VTLRDIKPLYGEILSSGALVGSYVVDALACEGGFASIYRAHHMNNRERAALKVLRLPMACSERLTLRFRQEAEVIRRLCHPHIVAIFEVGELYDGRPYIAMEWLDGHNLADEVRARGSFSEREALAIMTDICDAVAAAHSHGIIHRDIKAENVIAVPCGTWFSTKLVDFGIAKLTAPDDTPALITVQSILGTPQTMAPEQILGLPVDARTDIYALGILLYMLVTGCLPFEGDTSVEIEEMHLHATPPNASDVAPVSPALDGVLARALAKRKEDRQGCVAELLAALRAAVGADGPAVMEDGRHLRVAGVRPRRPRPPALDEMHRTIGSIAPVVPIVPIGAGAPAAPVVPIVPIGAGAATGPAGAVAPLDTRRARMMAPTETHWASMTGPTLHRVSGIGLCVEVHEPEGVAGAEIFERLDEIDEAMDAILDHAAEAATAAGLRVVLETGNAVLAAVPLPAEASAERDARRRVLGSALDLARELAALAAPVKVSVAVIVHVDVLEVQAHDTFVGGALLGLAQWPMQTSHARRALLGVDADRPSEHPPRLSAVPSPQPPAAPAPDGHTAWIAASAAALAGIDDGLARAPMDEALGCYWVVRAP
jgi:tRNA A-37 threonylcarbamoyl transferase component Bud32